MNTSVPKCIRLEQEECDGVMEKDTLTNVQSSQLALQSAASRPDTALKIEGNVRVIATIVSEGCS
jgi:hypothetical protein